MKSIFEYDNYRVFLRDFIVASKTQDKKFSYRFFARISGTNSPSFLKHVIDGKRNLTSGTIEKFIKALKLTKQEANFFKSLVFFNQAKTSEEKQHSAHELLHSRVYKKIYPLSVPQFNYYEHWYYIAVRELVSVKSFKEDPEWIAKKLRPAITPAEAKRALNELLKLGLIKREPSGKLILSDPIITTGNEVTSAAVTHYHKEMLKMAAESIERYPKPQREITAGAFGVSLETFKIIKEKMQKFRLEIQEIAARDQDPQTVCHLALQLFPLSAFENGDE